MDCSRWELARAQAQSPRAVWAVRRCRGWAGLFLWLGLLGFGSGPAMATVQAVQAEALRVGIYADFAPYEIWPASERQPSGADIELLNALSRSTGLRWTPVRYTDAARLERDLRQGELHLALSMARTPERAAALGFTMPYTDVEQALVSRRDVTSATVSGNLSGRSVGVVRGSAAARLVEVNFPAALRVVMDTPTDLLLAVQHGDVDLAFEALPALVQVIERRQMRDLRVLRRFQFDEGQLRIAARASEEGLIAQLNTALAALPPTRMAEFERRWSVVSTLTELPTRFRLDDADRRQVQATLPLRVGYVRSDPPFAFPDEAGRPAGLAIDLLHDLQTRTGLGVDSYVAANVGELLDGLAAGRLDLVLGLTETAQRRQSALFIGPYLSYPLVLIAAPDSGITDLRDLAGRRLASTPGYFANDEIRARYPGIQIVDCSRENSCQETVAHGLAEATINNLPAAVSRLAQRSGGAPLQIVGPVTGVFDQHALALRQGLAPLAPLLQRALDDVIATDLPVLQRRWLLPHVETGIRQESVRRGLMVAAGAVALLLAGWWAHTRRLRREVAARTRAQGQAEAASRARQQYLAFLAHEVRNSLSAVMGALSMLRHRDRSLSASAEGTALVDMVESSTRSTLGLLNDLLDHERIASGRLHLRLQATQLRTVVQAVLTEMQPAALVKGLSLKLEAGEDADTWHLLDGLRVGQVLRNLIANAVKFTPSGGVTLRLLSRGDRLHVEVHDTGIGIAPAVQQRLFEPFEQAEGTAAQGTGLGLALCRELARAMGGDVSVRSQPGQGACFSFEWQAQACEAPRALPPRSGGAVPADDAARQDVLVVEDSAVYGMVLEALLEARGLRVRTAGSVQEALRLFSERTPQLLLCDMHLPDGTALDLLGRIVPMRRTLGLGTRIMVMSSDVDLEQAEEWRLNGADRVIEKAFDPEEMAYRVFAVDEAVAAPPVPMAQAPAPQAAGER
jgi:two-component system sensor histidine kinase EvgS